MDPRHWLLVHLFRWSEKPYAWFKSRPPWGLSAADLRAMPEGSLGQVMGTYLERKGFELLPKLERHDFYHLLTGVGTEVPDEIALQYLVWGNGKRSAYLFGVVVLGTLVLPEQLPRFVAAYRVGAETPPFHALEFRELLSTPYAEVRATVARGQPSRWRSAPVPSAR